ncbi:DUF1338-domain-containing protein [Setomelanomma holmii]|uniref:2-oxoadipate dioxygenase/decarboxylase n=1 Tax=Setomelanomma holmii TaxID=210430 RepID=A0A9P4LLN1_9PLEO|nr:DUF1338-domain-containing protein [Setomelanomma holmii]
MVPMTIETDTSPRDEFDADELRTSFALAMSAMYKKEVPLYGNLTQIVRAVNEETLANASDCRNSVLKNGDVASERLEPERHGAIRLGTAHELFTVRRVFEIIGMYPVGYFDLSHAGLPMHATCFRPTTTTALRKNPFRIFTTLLRPELMEDDEARGGATNLLGQRSIFSEDLLRLLDLAERQGGQLKVDQGDLFVQEVMKTFDWKPIAATSKELYQTLKGQHPILADIACFRSAHINHLTPRTLNIAAAQERMKAEGMAVKERIEGPPPRDCPILLRQTSFLALEERIQFPTAHGELNTTGSHKARFGEIEERGAAVTLAGRELYDKLLDKAMRKISGHPSFKPDEQDQIVTRTFAQYPDSWDELRRHDLVYFHYRCCPRAKPFQTQKRSTREELLALDVMEAVPIMYEEFLPMSAAGIFQSNLGNPNSVAAKIRTALSDKTGYEHALRRPILDMNGLYAEAQAASLRACALELGLPEKDFVEQGRDSHI